MIRLVWYFRSGMTKLLYIFVPNEFVNGQGVYKLLIKRLGVAMLNKTVSCCDVFDKKNTLRHGILMFMVD
jgi:hypothetical protein